MSIIGLVWGLESDVAMSDELRGDHFMIIHHFGGLLLRPSASPSGSRTWSHWLFAR